LVRGGSDSRNSRSVSLIVSNDGANRAEISTASTRYSSWPARSNGSALSGLAAGLPLTSSRYTDAGRSVFDLTFQLDHSSDDLDLATLLKLRQIDPFQPAAGLGGVRRLRGKYEPDEQDRPPAAVPRARKQGMATFHYLASYPNQAKSLNRRRQGPVAALDSRASVVRIAAAAAAAPGRLRLD
jgi:hypothetical protein